MATTVAPMIGSFCAVTLPAILEVVTCAFTVAISISISIATTKKDRILFCIM